LLTLKDSNLLLNEVITLLKQNVTIDEQVMDMHQNMKYPRFIPIFYFQAHSYQIEEFGSLFTLETKALGKMYLTTMVFTPNQGTSMPVLLIDSMSLGKKRAVFIEYYDCTVKKEIPECLVKMARQYGPLPNYQEKNAWYIPLRAPYSLVKGNTVNEEKKLIQMLFDEVREYSQLIKQNTQKHSNNLDELQAFQKRMIMDGNPSSDILNKVLGEEEARKLFLDYIMPLDDTYKGE